MEINELISKIIIDLTSEGKTISNILRKALIIAETINNAEMSQWLNSELEGYKDSQKLPDYRVLNAALKGYFAGRTNGDFKVPISMLPENVSKDIEIHEVFSPIAEIQSTVNGQEEFLRFVLPQEMTSLFNNYINKSQCVSLWKQIHMSMFVGLIDKVKTKLLKFFLSIQKQYPNMKVELLQKDSEKITSVFNQTIIHGNNNAVQNATNSKNNSIAVNDIKSLISELKQFNLTKDLINELKNIKKAEPNFKDNIKKWVNDLPIKLGDKMLDAFSFGTLVKIIATYAGIKL